jgi:hypothetical protein
VIVTWHTAVPARRVLYAIVAHPITPSDPRSFASRRGRGRRSFRVVLKPRRRVRRIELVGYSIDRPDRLHKRVVVPVSG